LYVNLACYAALLFLATIQVTLGCELRGAQPVAVFVTPRACAAINRRVRKGVRAVRRGAAVVAYVVLLLLAMGGFICNSQGGNSKGDGPPKPKWTGPINKKYVPKPAVPPALQEDGVQIRNFKSPWSFTQRLPVTDGLPVVVCGLRYYDLPVRTHQITIQELLHSIGYTKRAAVNQASVQREFFDRKFKAFEAYEQSKYFKTSGKLVVFVRGSLDSATYTSARLEKLPTTLVIFLSSDPENSFEYRKETQEVLEAGPGVSAPLEPAASEPVVVEAAQEEEGPQEATVIAPAEGQQQEENKPAEVKQPQQILEELALEWSNQKTLRSATRRKREATERKRFCVTGSNFNYGHPLVVVEGACIDSSAAVLLTDSSYKTLVVLCSPTPKQHFSNFVQRYGREPQPIEQELNEQMLTASREEFSKILQRLPWVQGVEVGQGEIPRVRGYDLVLIVGASCGGKTTLANLLVSDVAGAVCYHADDAVSFGYSTMEFCRLARHPKQLHRVTRRALERLASEVSSDLQSFSHLVGPGCVPEDFHSQPNFGAIFSKPPRKLAQRLKKTLWVLLKLPLYSATVFVLLAFAPWGVHFKWLTKLQILAEFLANPGWVLLSISYVVHRLSKTPPKWGEVPPKNVLIPRARPSPETIEISGSAVDMLVKGPVLLSDFCDFSSLRRIEINNHLIEQEQRVQLLVSLLEAGVPDATELATHNCGLGTSSSATHILRGPHPCKVEISVEGPTVIYELRRLYSQLKQPRPSLGLERPTTVEESQLWGELTFDQKPTITPSQRLISQMIINAQMVVDTTGPQTSVSRLMVKNLVLKANALISDISEKNSPAPEKDVAASMANSLVALAIPRAQANNRSLDGYLSAVGVDLR